MSASTIILLLLIMLRYTMLMCVSTESEQMREGSKYGIARQHVTAPRKEKKSPAN